MSYPLKSDYTTDYTTHVKSPPKITMIHHNPPLVNNKIVYSIKALEKDKSIIDRCIGYGVSSTSRVLSVGLFQKKYDQVRDCLQYTLGLSCGQREVVLRLLNLWAYYGKVYPKESQITDRPGCSKATYWRTIRRLKSTGLVRVCNRFLTRPHAQISNLYLLHGLLVVIARYLAEHGTRIYSKWVEPYLKLPGVVFWTRRFFNPQGEGPPECLPLGPLLC